jgi:hypothetical protein
MDFRFGPEGREGGLGPVLVQCLLVCFENRHYCRFVVEPVSGWAGVGVVWCAVKNW